MGNYIQFRLEPKIPGLQWEDYLGNWRAKRGKTDGGWMAKGDIVKHMFSLSGVYPIISAFCMCVLLFNEATQVEKWLGVAGLLLLLTAYVYFFAIYIRGGNEVKRMMKESEAQSG